MVSPYTTSIKVERDHRQRTVTYRHKGTGEEHTLDVERREWTLTTAPLSGDFASLGLG
jgi:hypothetical protein